MRRHDDIAKLDQDIARAVLEVTSWPPQTAGGPRYSQIMAARLIVDLSHDLRKPVDARVHALAAHPLPGDRSPHKRAGWSPTSTTRRRARWWHPRRSS